MSKDKDNTTLYKIKQFFKAGPKAGSNNFVLTADIERELKPETPIAQRIRAIRDLEPIVLQNNLEDFAVQKLYDLTKDLIVLNKPAEQRHLVLNFYGKLIQGQFKDLSIMRALFFRLIQDHNIDEDITIRLELLNKLTENGKNIQNFEEEIPKFMIKWIPEIYDAKLMASYLEIFVNIIKFNTAYVDREIIIEIVQQACIWCSMDEDKNTVLQCLYLLETVISYAQIPNEILVNCVTALCRTVKEAYCVDSHKIMKKLLCTQLGFASLLIMCGMLNDRRYYSEPELLRGAVFHIYMGLWGSPTNSMLTGLKYSSTVLLSYSHVLSCEHIIVTYEVILSIKSLIQKYGYELGEPSWDIIINILTEILEILDKLQVPEQNEVHHRYHDILTLIEELIHKQQINADVDKIYSIIERVAEYRSEESVKNLLHHKFKNISVMRPNWLRNLHEFVERFYKMHSNPNIRIKTIEYLKEAVESNRTGYEEEILEKVVIVLFSDVHLENDIKIRTSVCSMILDICLHCDTKRCLEMLEILEKVLNRPFEIFAMNRNIVGECEDKDILAVVNGLIDLFLEKLHRLPSSHAIKIYYIMVNHLERHYNEPQVFSRAKNVRYNIINWMLKVRANSAFQIGYPYPKLISNNFKYSYFLGVEGDYQHPPSSLQGDNEDKYSYTNSTLSIKRGCKIIVKVLTLETDWSILQLLLRELPKIMQNKTLIQGNDIDLLAKTMGNLFLNVMDSNKTFKFAETSIRPTTGDFRALVIPAMSSVFTYNQFLEVRTKRFITELLKNEIKMDSNRIVLSICIQTFTILLMEKCESFQRFIADVLLAISKVSDTVSVSIPILEFMSTITHLPYGFSNLNQKQFSYIFATCLPYTNPVRYDHYTVCLAHQIIARWFLKSRLQWRKEYAGYIIEGIAKNIKNSDLESKHEQELRALAHMNEDSSNRMRSSSLTEQIYKRRERDNTFLQKTRELNKQRLESKNNFNMHEFHLELIETCYDFMTRHTFSLASALPRRLPSADFLLRGGQSQSWIVENSVITITTSGCSSNPVKNGLCERCNSICKLQQSRNSLDSIRRSKDELNSEGTSIGSKPFSPFSGFSNSTSNNSMCACCCVGWAEIFIRRPTGNTSWIMKIQNSVSFGSSYSDVSLHDLTALFSQMPSDDSEFDDDSKSTISSNQIPLSTPEPIKSTENIAKKLAMESNSQYSTPPIDIPNQQRANDLDSENGGDPDDGDVSFDDDTESTSRNPVRRVNSSPEMSSNWKNNFANKGSKHDSKDNNQDDSTETIVEETQQKKKSKDTKVSCEAIPEEITPMASSVEETFERPTLYTSISAVEQTNVTLVPKKQFSADDTLQLRKETSFNTEPRILPSPFARNMELQKVVTKPPQFPQPLSPRTIYKGTKHISVIDSAANEDSSSRMRSKTISVIGRENAHLELRKNASEFQSSVFEQQQQTSISSSSGISPSFVFLQLYHSGKFGESDRPILIPDDQLSAINILDLIVPYELHRIGVLYVGKGQAKSEAEILKNRFGSLRYAQFLRNLGTLVALKDAKENNLFINMDGECGKFTYVWTDEIVQVTFHVATLMPTLETDPNCNEKKKHIGNDYVLIVYNESGEEYNLNTIKGQFNYAAIIVEPLELGSNLISIQTKNDIHEYFKHLEPKIVSDNGAPLFARQIALHANMASMVSVSLKKGFADPYASNWLERLRKIKRLKKRVLNEKNPVTTGSDSGTTYTTTSTIVRDVFTKYT